MQQSYQVNEKEFHSEPFYDDKHIKTKMKLCNVRINRNFLKKITNEGAAFLFCDIIRFLLLR